MKGYIKSERWGKYALLWDLFAHKASTQKLGSYLQETENGNIQVLGPEIETPIRKNFKLVS